MNRPQVAPPGRGVAVVCPACDLIDVSAFFRVSLDVEVVFRLTCDPVPRGLSRLMGYRCGKCGADFAAFTLPASATLSGGAA